MSLDDNVLPRWAITRWLLECAGEIPRELRRPLIQGLYGSLPIFIGGVTNTILVSSIVATRIATPAFMIWAVLEICLAAIRLPLLVSGSRAIEANDRTHIDFYVGAAVLWAASVGYGCFITLLSGDWISSALVCLSAAAMSGGVAFRNFAAPRLVMVMILLSLGPCAVAGVLSGELLMLATAIQIPMYIYAITSAAYRLNGMLVQTMRSEHENKLRAHRDPLTGLLNRAGLEREFSERQKHPELGCTLFYIDLDGFKQFNDTLGHACGDQLLVVTSSLMAGLVHSGEAVARVGGDEFVIVSEKMDAARARSTGQQLIEAICATPIFGKVDVATVSASIGIAISSGVEWTFPDLLLEADRALYEAKVGGRCRVAISSSAAPALYLASDRGLATNFQSWKVA